MAAYNLFFSQVHGTYPCRQHMGVTPHPPHPPRLFNPFPNHIHQYPAAPPWKLSYNFHFAYTFPFIHYPQYSNQYITTKYGKNFTYCNHIVFRAHFWRGSGKCHQFEMGVLDFSNIVTETKYYHLIRQTITFQIELF